MTLKQNTLLQGGKYRIVRFISSGGFGCTYEAEHVMLGERVAIKEFFVKDFCNRDERTAHVTVGTQSKKGLIDKLKRKFVEEAKMLYRMQHTGIVRVFDIFEENGTAYFVMDYIDGASLKEIVAREGALPEARAVRYIRQVAEALEFVHSKDRLHLDIKPGNIMVDSQDNAILIDFGTSKQYDEVNGENTSTVQGYTEGFAPPEQMNNHVVKFMPATDIYALGATLYKMLTGITPPSATIRISGEELDTLPTSVSTATEKAIEHAMQLNKTIRPQTVDAFLALLGRETGTVRPTHSCPTMDEDKTMLVETMYSSPSSENNHENKINGHEFVDLGLSVKWATCNVGASSPEEYGYYFAWGETSTKSKFSLNNYKYVVRILMVWKYKPIGALLDRSSYDAACACWGGSWRMPSQSEFQELKDKCSWVWTTQGGHNGCRITGPNGKSIFLPAAGLRYEKSAYECETEACYWEMTPNYTDTKYVNAFSFSSNGFNTRRCGYGYCGLSIRPVTE